MLANEKYSLDMFWLLDGEKPLGNSRNPNE